MPRYRATRPGDVFIGRRPIACFEGQVYDLPEDVVEGKDWLVAEGTPGDEPSDPPNDDGLDDMTVRELRALASERELPTTGRKPELIERLRE